MLFNGGLRTFAALSIGPWVLLVIPCVVTMGSLAFMMCPPLLSSSSGICRVLILLVFIVLGQPHLRGWLDVLTISGSGLIASTDGIASCLCLVGLCNPSQVISGWLCVRLPLSTFHSSCNLHSCLPGTAVCFWIQVYVISYVYVYGVMWCHGSSQAPEA